MTMHVTLKDLIAWHKPHRRADGESVGQLLKCRLRSQSVSLIEDPRVRPAMTKAAFDGHLRLIGSEGFDQVAVIREWGADRERGSPS